VGGLFGFIKQHCSQTHFRLLATAFARVLQIRSPQKRRGRREDRVRAAPAVSRARVVRKTHTSIQVQRRQSGLPCAMVLQLISCSPRRDLACLSPSSPRSLLLRNSTPATGASGPHDFAVRFSHARQSQPSRPSLPDPRFVTNAHTPLWWDGMAIEVKLICPRDQARPLRHIGTTGKSPKCCQDLFAASMHRTTATSNPAAGCRMLFSRPSGNAETRSERPRPDTPRCNI
jgi:hypothetical protein